MDKSIPANTTLSKLIDARRRGVNTVLFVDDLQQYLNPELLREYQSVGGTFCSLNPLMKLSSLKKIHNKEAFRRHHEKMLVSDEKSIIGSSNLESGYACKQ
jgi:phosphatidylserine/phosphatidylglycerophosphate/cardiolipin synthase-like enzyme